MDIDIRQAVHPEHAKQMDTAALRRNFLVDRIFVPGTITLTYSLFDRIVFGGIVPTTQPLSLEPSPAFATGSFLARREIGLINLGGSARVDVDGATYDLGHRDGLYVGMGNRSVTFTSASPDEPAMLYCVSTTAHHGYPTRCIKQSDAKQVHLGTSKESNTRTIYQYVHPAVLTTCQLAMGLTILEPENVWNTMPCHTHDRRMEVYFYLDVPRNGLVFHYMGQPNQTRHIVVRNHQAVISPNWSIHSGVGTSNYSFIWAMAGENQEFTDMDAVAVPDLL